MVEVIVAKSIEGVTKKYNAELAGLRKKLEAARTPEASETPAPAAPTADDLEAAMSIGELRRGLPEHVREAIAAQSQGRSFADRRWMYETAASLFEATAAEPAKARGVTPEPTGGVTPKTSRAAVSAVRESASHPQTVDEYLEIAKSDPKRKRQLDADPTFDPQSLRQY